MAPKHRKIIHAAQQRNANSNYTETPFLTYWIGNNPNILPHTFYWSCRETGRVIRLWQECEVALAQGVSRGKMYNNHYWSLAIFVIQLDAWFHRACLPTKQDDSLRLLLTFRVGQLIFENALVWFEYMKGRATNLIQALPLLKVRERSHSKSTADLGPVLEIALDLVPRTWMEKMGLLWWGSKVVRNLGVHENYLGNLKKKKIKQQCPRSHPLRFGYNWSRVGHRHQYFKTAPQVILMCSPCRNQSQEDELQMGSWVYLKVQSNPRHLLKCKWGRSAEADISDAGYQDFCEVRATKQVLPQTAPNPLTSGAQEGLLRGRVPRGVVEMRTLGWHLSLLINKLSGRGSDFSRKLNSGNPTTLHLWSWVSSFFSQKLYFILYKTEPWIWWPELPQALQTSWRKKVGDRKRRQGSWKTPWGPTHHIHIKE